MLQLFAQLAGGHGGVEHDGAAAFNDCDRFVGNVDLDDAHKLLNPCRGAQHDGVAALGEGARHEGHELDLQRPGVMHVVQPGCQPRALEHIALDQLARGGAGVGPPWGFKQGAVHQRVIGCVGNDGVAPEQGVGVVAVRHPENLAEVDAAKSPVHCRGVGVQVVALAVDHGNARHGTAAVGGVGHDCGFEQFDVCGEDGHGVKPQ